MIGSQALMVDERATVPADAAALIRSAWDECGADCDREELLIQGLTLISTRFRDGLDAYDGDEYGKAAEMSTVRRAVAA